jgi:glycosyltransferase involved in cell wall biosynthesis
MKAAIYNPYLDTLGGGERYTTAFAKVLSEAGYKVDVQWKSSGIRKKLEKRFGFNLTGINFVKDIKRGDGYDVCFWLSDGSIPQLKARNNILHFQFPFTSVNGKSLINRMKLFRINEVICNSHFTKRFIDKEYGVNSRVVYPPIDIESIEPRKKENVILSVGRFSQLTQIKKQDVLITSFKRLHDKCGKGWRLILAGGAEIGADKYLEKLKKMITDYPIEMIKSPDYKKLLSLYGKAKIFWSASGYGADEEKEPLKVEHFGMTVVEAMAAGAVPIIFNAGGHREIIKDGKNGYLWNKGQLVKLTEKIVKDGENLKSLANNAYKDSKKYGYERFKKSIESIL